MKGWRNITINGVMWKWKLGSSCCFARCENPRAVEHRYLTEITGMSWDQIERACNKGYFSVTPKMVAKWLEEVS